VKCTLTIIVTKILINNRKKWIVTKMRKFSDKSPKIMSSKFKFNQE
jgi:hypothetical protein